MIIDIDPIRGLIEKVGGDMKTKLPNLIHINGLTPEFRDSFTDLLREKRVPIVYAAHFSHLDGPVISDVCKAFICIAQEAELEDMLRGFSLTVASSMREGHQGKFLERFIL